MNSIHYSAAWTDSDLFCVCCHEHETIGEAHSCIPCAGGYIVAVENGVMRALTAKEEAEFQCVHYARRTDRADMTVTVVPQETSSDSRYAVMTPIWVVDHWTRTTRTTWMCFEAYAEAAAYAREGSKVVRFRSPEWAALEQQEWAAPPQHSETAASAREIDLSRREGETLVEFVLRFLDARSLDQHAQPFPRVNDDAVEPSILVGLTLILFKRWETAELERVDEIDKQVVLSALVRLFHLMHKSQR
jgi:hypothetical protein